MRTSLLGNVTGALLLGGESTRMGRDKAHLLKDGLTWSTRTARLLASLFDETLLVGGRPEEAAEGRRVSDVAGPGCALRGLVAALEAASAPRVLVVATDLPLLSPDLLLALTAWPEHDVVVPTDAAGDHPLCAIYRRESCLEVARENLVSDRLAIHELLARVDTERVSLLQLGIADVGAEPLMNVNTPGDLARLEAS